MLFILIVFGLLVGSFLNVVIYRIPRGQGIVLGRSHCPRCHHELVWHDLIPVVSFVLGRGRCKYCHAPISWIYPAVETAVAFLVVASWYQWGATLGWLYWFFTLAILLSLFASAVIDLRHLLLPDGILIFLGVIASIFAIAVRFMHVANPFSTFSLAAVAVAFVLAGAFFLLWYFSRGRWLGFGDVKLLALLGLVFGFPGAAIVTYGGVILGGIVGVAVLISGHGTGKTKLPLGTFLCASGILYVFFYQIILDRLMLFFR